jgi:predicted transcriptional regulator
MADGSLTSTLTLTFDDATIARLEEAARATGEAPEVYASKFLARALEAEDWAEDVRRLEEYDRTGEWISVDEAFAHLDARIAERRAKRG